MNKKYTTLSVLAFSLVIAGILSQTFLLNIRTFFVIIFGLIVLLIGYALCIIERKENPNFLNITGEVIGSIVIILFLILLISTLVQLLVLSKTPFSFDNFIQRIIGTLVDIIKK